MKNKVEEMKCNVNYAWLISHDPISEIEQLDSVVGALVSYKLIAYFIKKYMFNVEEHEKIIHILFWIITFEE